MAKVWLSSPLISAILLWPSCDQQPRCLLERAFIIDVQKRIVEIQPFGAAVHDIGDTEVIEQRDAPVRRSRRRDIDGIHLLVGHDAPVGRFLLIGSGGAQHEVEVVGARIIAQPGQELDEMRVDVHACAGRHHVADHPGLAGGQPAGARVGPVAVPLGGVHYAPARLLVDLRIAVQGAAHRGLRQGQHVRKLFQVHRRSSKALSNRRRICGAG